MAKKDQPFLKKNKKGTGSMIQGGIFLLFSLLMLMDSPPPPLSPSRYLQGLLLVLLCYWGVLNLGKGFRARHLNQRLLRLTGLYNGPGRIPLSTAAQTMGYSVSRLVEDVRAMQAQGMVKGLYADLIRKDLVWTGDRVVAPPPLENREETGVILREEHRKSVLPLYRMGLAWIIYALSLPMITGLDFVLAALVGLIAYFTTAWKTPDRVVILEQVEVVKEPEPTGNAALDEMLRGVQGHLADLRRLDKAIDGTLDGPVREILSTTERIVEELHKHPTSAAEMRQFFNYTLPTTINLLQSYDELSRQPVQGKNITDAMGKIEGMIDSIVDAFHRQHDALFRDKALNIAVELEVMEQMLGRAGTGSISDAFDDFK